MKKLELKGMKMLSKEQMKKIAGGVTWCSVTWASGCSGSSIWDCDGDPETCQNIGNNACLLDNCCSDVDCGQQA